MYRLLLLFIVFLSCKTTSTDNSISPEAAAYIDEVVTILKANSINRNKIDWPIFEAKVLAKADKAKTVEETYPAIHLAIKLLGDGHSYFAPAVGDNTEENGAPPMLTDEKVPNDIGYLRVRYCMGSNDQKQIYVDDLLKTIRQRDKDNLKGWIVDLRGNFGGDMLPMLLGTGPILGDGILGYTAYPDGQMHSWNYEQGKFYYDAIEDSDIKVKEYYRLKRLNPFVAVLTDTLTASSGEALTVAFKGREKTKSFGYKTYGVSTSNQKFVLSDGSNMLITVAVFADRNKKRYGHSIEPDKVVVPENVLQEAIEWLRVQN
ncbi:S41 family peptidase [Flavobacterium cerinum]|uniref:Peptidase S41 n=1 Tax=Flavobacterium cerinum TaxID=2502784 RepID=A0A3S3QUE9_9FLAO|nr:S41 family peptidase [Flavobacterium cerinum]RWX03828.1 peptidase S41 [Flavobacterium cerinum]